MLAVKAVLYRRRWCGLELGVGIVGHFLFGGRVSMAPVGGTRMVVLAAGSLRYLGTWVVGDETMALVRHGFDSG